MKPKIVHLTTVHNPFDTRIFAKECSTLAAAGYEVVLIAPHDRDEVRNGVRVRALKRRPGRLYRMLVTAGSLLRLAWSESGAVYHFHDPELIPVGLALKLGGKRVVYDVHENVPRQILTKHYLPTGLRAPVALAFSLVERIGVRAFDAVVAAYSSIALRFPTSVTVIVNNYALPNEFCLGEPSEYQTRHNHIAYVGGLSAVRGVREMAEATKLLPEAQGARLLLGGPFSPANLKHELQQLESWKVVEYLGYLSRAQVADVLGKSRVGLLCFQPAPHHVDAQPNKLFEYMAAGLPVVASDFPYWREVVMDAQCGLLVDPQDPSSIATAIGWLLEHPKEAQEMGERGREAVLSRYNWASEAEKLLNLYEKLTG